MATVIAGFMCAPVQRPGLDTTKPTMTRPTSIDTMAHRTHRSAGAAPAPIVPHPQRTRVKTANMKAVVRPSSPRAIPMSSRSGLSRECRILAATSPDRALTKTMPSVFAAGPKMISAVGPEIIRGFERRTEQENAHTDDRPGRSIGPGGAWCWGFR